jgi:hypothetical protein
MEAPEEFKRLAQCFWQGSEREAVNEHDWIARALKLSSPDQQAIIKKFLTELLASDADVNELQRIWRSGGPSYGIRDLHIKSFLQRIRESI